MSTRLASAVALVLALGTTVHAQPASPHLEAVEELLLTDGSRLYGSVESQTDDEVVFVTTSGARITAPRDRVVSIRQVVGRVVQGEFRREDPNDTRLLFGPTGRTLQRGEMYLGVYEFLLPFVQVGITDRISIGGGTPLVFGLGEDFRPFWVTPKVQIVSRAGTHVAAGLFHGFSRGNGGAGIAYGVLTRDTAAGSFTVGTGMGYTSDGERGGVVMVGADGPVRRNMKIITENYVWRSAGVASAGVRFFGENLSADLAIGVFLGGDTVFALPVVNFVYRF